MRQYEGVLALAALLLMASGVWLAWGQGRAGEAQAAPLSTAPPEATARWRYAPVPEADMAAVRQSDTELEARERAYQQAWQAYVAQLRHCQDRPPRTCSASPLQAACDDRALLQCLGAVVPALDAARGALHDQAIGVEQAAQRLAGKTE